MPSVKVGFIVLFLSVCTFSVCADSSLHYQRKSGVSGNLTSVGSDTLANMMTLWAEAFRHIYPAVNIQIQAAGSSTAPPALIEGTASIGPMSRRMKAREQAAFERRYGYPPLAIPVAVDALAVYVHKDNPLKGLTVAQVDAIFSANRKCGYPDDLTKWNQLGLTGFWNNQFIQLFGRNSVSGTYGYFKKRALCRGDFKSSINEQPGSASVVQAVTSTANAIGYSGLGYYSSGVKAIPISSDGHNYVAATSTNAANGSYPLSRILYIYINKHPNRALAPMEAEFIRFILSKQGQAIVENDGYVRVPNTLVQQTLKALGVNAD